MGGEGDEENECKSMDGCECMCVAVAIVEKFVLPLTAEDPQLYQCYDIIVIIAQLRVSRSSDLAPPYI